MSGVAIDACSSTRLIVVLAQACLETYKVSSGSALSQGRRGDKGEDRYMCVLSRNSQLRASPSLARYVRSGVLSAHSHARLLNADDHQGILARMGREVATARPDITHQVRRTCSTSLTVSACSRCSIRP